MRKLIFTEEQDEEKVLDIIRDERKDIDVGQLKHAFGWNKPLPNDSNFNDFKYLIVGSIPSQVGFNEGIYYGSKNNKFWKLLDKIFNTNGEYENAIDRYRKTKTDNIRNEVGNLLKKNKVMLFDLYKECWRLDNSLDSKIVCVRINDFKDILTNNLNIRILCNSRYVYNIFKRIIKSININVDKQIFYVPSPSPRNVKSIDIKVEAWKKALGI